MSEHDFLKAFDTYADPLYRHAFFRLSDKDKASDCVQDTFARAWSYIARGGTVEDARAFLYRTMHNLIIDEYRKQKTSSLDELMGREGGGFDATDDTALRPIERTITQDMLGRAMEELPENYRLVVTLRYIDERSPAEIAKELGESEGAISVRLHRGLKKLREILENQT